MVQRNKEGSLTEEEREIVKALLGKGWRNQDIQALINIGRSATINSARVAEVKKDENQKAASDEVVEFFKIKKKSYDLKTGLNLFENERLIRAREAMILAVQIFNSAALNFKTEVFSVLVNIAWTYLLHEYYEKNGVKIVQKDGRTLLLGQMIERRDSPLSVGIRNNLRSMKEIRDSVEHVILGKSDVKWQGLFQACCLNFNKTLCSLFGEQLSLSGELSFALQFQKMDIEQLATLNKYEIPAHIAALDARLEKDLPPEQLKDLEYQFRVIYTLDSSTKSRAHFEFIRPDSAEGKDIRNVLVQHKLADDLYPLKPGQVCKEVSQKIGRNFSTRNHTQAWKFFKVRPPKKSKQPDNTQKEYCIYHSAHKDYTYSNKWVEFLSEKMKDEQHFEQIRKVDIRE